MPTLSVLIPNYNHGRFLRETVDAILSQSHKPDEILILDDCSEDDSVDVIRNIAEKDGTVKLFRNEKNLGVVHTANRLLDMASGDYIYWAAADDRILPGFLEKSMNLLARYPQAGLCCSNPVYFRDPSGATEIIDLEWRQTPGYLHPAELVRALRQKNGFIYGHTSILKRDIVRQMGGLHEELKWHCDWFLQHAIGFRHGICYIPEPLAAMRVLTKSYSTAGTRDWTTQKKVLGSLLDILASPENKDILPLFQKSNLTRQFGIGVPRLVVTNVKYWRIKHIKCIPPFVFLMKNIIDVYIFPAAEKYLPGFTESVRRIYTKFNKG